MVLIKIFFFLCSFSSDCLCRKKCNVRGNLFECWMYSIQGKCTWFVVVSLKAAAMTSFIWKEIRKEFLKRNVPGQNGLKGEAGAACVE